jgi:heme exporter protein A
MRLRASNIAVERGARRLFSNLSFEVARGEALLVVGPNGVGKSSLLRAIVGLLPLADGTLSREGGDPDASLGEEAHYVGHADALKGALTARENLEFWAAMLATFRRSRAGAGELAVKGPMNAAQALDRLGLQPVLDLPVHALSAGQKRRVALARILVAERPLWILDEPLTALDEAAERLFVAVLREHLAAGGLLVAATHLAIDLAGARELRLGETQVSP